MEPDEYERMDRVEDAMWWYRALHHRVLAALRRNPGDPGLPLLDAGCGTGGLLRRLADAFPTRQLVGVDVAAEAARRARRKVPGAAVAVGSIDALPFGDGRFGAAVSCDVLCHRLVEEAAALAELRRVLAPGGVLVLNLPAHRWLLSAHDRRVHNARRYDRAGLRGLLEGAGFRPIALGYWNSLLLPLMVVQRKVLGRFRGAEASDVAPFSPPIDAIFRAVTETEAALARLGVRFPAGGSLLAIARRP
ncbi:class I SAM-dependent methyltransferase [Elioraea sp. Yellowstone]|jgi:ubiquinone/menaquinone biosynthesis C-methylase UbiE|uniref:class I SAM-dependent DNA methyltransferase n=1 Tax=Elioraea sp. Yellowstone TaxID=2592070 RepID=UPI001152B760|nr:class I SAM-dependent methyltransferase [Elioraea sp. Yellowstone]TQF85669.1 class I SAM-dependent methyltransferase [Elioraea sp. Yellowstone]